MTLEELVDQWRVMAGRSDDYSPGLTEAADELEDWILHHKGEAV